MFVLVCVVDSVICRWVVLVGIVGGWMVVMWMFLCFSVVVSFNVGVFLLIMIGWMVVGDGIYC